MKQEGNYSIPEQKDMYPFEWELYYYQTVNDYRERKKAQIEEEQNRALQR